MDEEIWIFETDDQTADIFITEDGREVHGILAGDALDTNEVIRAVKKMGE